VGYLLYNKTISIVFFGFIYIVLFAHHSVIAKEKKMHKAIRYYYSQGLTTYDISIILSKVMKNPIRESIVTFILYNLHDYEKLFEKHPKAREKLISTIYALLSDTHIVEHIKNKEFGGNITISSKLVLSIECIRRIVDLERLLIIKDLQKLYDYGITVNEMKLIMRFDKRILLLLMCITYLSGFCSNLAGAKLSKKQEEKLNELIKISKPSIPIFGKVNEPLKAKLSLFQHLPNTIYLNKEEESTIKLPSKAGKGDSILELEAIRRELQKAEQEGLNFIQPSLNLTLEEQKAIDEFFSRNEQEQLLNLWKATIERNKTIQFIVQKLSPTNSPQEANSILAKTIGAAIFLPFYALQAISDNVGAYYGGQLGGRVLGSVIEGKMKKNQAELQLSQTESIILFMMIDEVAERLRNRYHSYKKLMVERVLATKEVEEAKKDALEAQELNVSGGELIANIQRRGIEREVRKLDAQIRAQKNALVELSGPEAVGMLDEQLKLELAATQNTPLDF